MKQGNSDLMAILLEGLEKYQVDEIKVFFKQTNSQEAEAIKEARYKSDGTGDCELKNSNVLLIPWTIEETYKFKNGEQFFVDFQIFAAEGVMPKVGPIQITMDDTLLSKEEALAHD